LVSLTDDDADELLPMVTKVLVEALLRLVGRATSGSWTSGVNTWPHNGCPSTESSTPPSWRGVLRTRC
jgi:hypothetical protein